jgi:hypothetical protein
MKRSKRESWVCIHCGYANWNGHDDKCPTRRKRTKRKVGCEAKLAALERRIKAARAVLHEIEWTNHNCERQSAKLKKILRRV